MDELDLVSVYNPSGQLKKIKRQDLSKALEHGYKPVEQKEADPGILESGLDILGAGARGVASGLTLDWSEEAISKAKAFLKAKSEQEKLSLYKKYLEEEEAKTEQAKEKHPWAYGVGEVGGFLLPAFLTEGASLAATGGTATGEAIAKLSGKELVKALAKKSAAGAAAGFVPGTITGAVIGGGASKGRWEGGTPEEKEQLIKDVIGGGVIGGATSAGLGALAPAAPSIIKGAKAIGGGISDLAKAGLEKTIYGKQVLEAAKMGAAGEGVLSEAQRKPIIEGIGKAATKFQRMIEGVVGATSKIVREPLEKASKAGEVIKLTTRPFQVGEATVVDGAKQLETLGEFDLAKKLSNAVLKGDIDPLSAYDLRSKLRSIGKMNPSIQTTMEKIVSEIDNDLADFSLKNASKYYPSVDLKKLGGQSPYKRNLSLFSDIYKTLPESLQDLGGAPLEYRGAQYTSKKEADKQIHTNILRLISRLYAPGAIRDEAYRTLIGEGGLETLFPQLIAKYPEEMERIAKSAGYVEGGGLRPGQFISGKYETPEELFSALKETLHGAARKASAYEAMTGERAFEQSAMAAPVGILEGTWNLASRRIPLTGLNLLAQATGKEGAGIAGGALGGLAGGALGAVTAGPKGAVSGAAGGAYLGGLAGKFVKGAAEELEKKVTTSTAGQLVAKRANEIYRLPENNLLQFAEYLAKTPNLSNYGDNLKKALQAGDSVKKQAVLFAMMQNPLTKKHIDKFFGVGEEK